MNSKDPRSKAILAGLLVACIAAGVLIPVLWRSSATSTLVSGVRALPSYQSEQEYLDRLLAEATTSADAQATDHERVRGGSREVFSGGAFLRNAVQQMAQRAQAEGHSDVARDLFALLDQFQDAR